MAIQVAVGLLRGPFAKQYLPVSEASVEDLRRDTRRVVDALMEGIDEVAAPGA